MKEAQRFYSPGYSIRALPRLHSRPTLDCGPLLQEPAITDLDWSFAPSPRSWEPVALEHPFAPPREFPLASSCPGEDQPVSGLTPVTSRLFRRCTSPYGCVLVAFALASWFDHLTLPQRQTPRPVFQDGQCDPDPLQSVLLLPAISSWSIFSFEPHTSVTMQFQVLFTSLAGYFSTFTHITSALSVTGCI